MNDAATDMALQRIVMKKKGTPGSVGSSDDFGNVFDDDEDDALIENLGQDQGDSMAFDIPDALKRKGLYDFPKPPPPKG